MIEVVTPDIAFLYQQKLDEMHRLRHRVFKERLGWTVNSRNGKERDVYDLLNPIYLLATDEQGRVKGTWRLLPSTGSYMLPDIFSELLDGEDAPRHPLVWEASRFAIDIGCRDAGRSNTVNRVTIELFAGLVEWCLLFGIKEIIGVYDVRLGRLMKRVGVNPKWQSQAIEIGNTVTVAGRFEISDEVLASIRRAGGVTESVLWDAPVPMEARYAA